MPDSLTQLSLMLRRVGALRIGKCSLRGKGGSGGRERAGHSRRSQETEYNGKRHRNSRQFRSQAHACKPKSSASMIPAFKRVAFLIPRQHVVPAVRVAISNQESKAEVR